MYPIPMRNDSSLVPLFRSTHSVQPVARVYFTFKKEDVTIDASNAYAEWLESLLLVSASFRRHEEARSTTWNSRSGSWALQLVESLQRRMSFLKFRGPFQNFCFNSCGWALQFLDGISVPVTLQCWGRQESAFWHLKQFDCILLYSLILAIYSTVVGSALLWLE